MATPIQAEFWALESQYFWEEMHNLIFDTMLQSMNNALPLMPAAIRPFVDWELANQAALDFIRDYRLILNGVTETTARQTIETINRWIRNGDPLKILVNELEPLYGRTRAQLIASTEVTRVYAAGNMAMWQSTGLVGGKKWQTARDERVCPICGPLHNQIVSIDEDFSLSPEQVATSPQMRAILGERYNEGLALQRAAKALAPFVNGNQQHPPAHPRCRCWLLPFVSLPMLEDRIGGILAGQFFADVKTGKLKTVGVIDGR